jgi:hypothetical protein
MSSSRLPARPSLEQLRKKAKDLLQRVRVGDRAALERLHAVIPNRQTRNEPIRIMVTRTTDSARGNAGR